MSSSYPKSQTLQQCAESLLETLAARIPYSRGKDSAEMMEVGDVVLLYEDSLPRGFWKLARVIELITGRDGRHRGAVIRVPTKDGRTTILRRPLQLLYPLEIKSEDPEPRKEHRRDATWREESNVKDGQ